MQEFRSIFNELIEQNNLYVYEEDEASIGMFKLTPQLHRASHIISLGGVAIDPSFSGKGFGQRMLDQIILLVRESGFLRMELGVSAINTKAIHLYEKAGFKKEGLLKKYIYLKNEGLYLDDVIMACLFE